MPSHLACPRSHCTNSMRRVPRIGGQDVQWISWNRVTLRGCILHAVACLSRGRPPAHGNVPRVCWVVIQHRQMASHFGQKVNFHIAPYFFSFMSIVGFKRLTMGGYPLEVNGLGAQIVVPYLAGGPYVRIRAWARQWHQ